MDNCCSLLDKRNSNLHNLNLGFIWVVLHDHTQLVLELGTCLNAQWSACLLFWFIDDGNRGSCPTCNCKSQVVIFLANCFSLIKLTFCRKMYISLMHSTNLNDTTHPLAFTPACKFQHPLTALLSLFINSPRWKIPWSIVVLAHISTTTPHAVLNCVYAGHCLSGCIFFEVHSFHLPNLCVWFIWI